MELDGKTCLVTGGSGGIGKAVAAGLAGKGARVIIVNHNRQRGEAALQEIRRVSGSSKVYLMSADLSSQAEIRKLAEEFISLYGELHILVNVAGSLFKKRRLSVDGLEMTFALNYLAYFLLTHLLLDLLSASAPARIINVASIGHWWGKINLDDLQSEKHYNMFQVYGNSKLAILLFTRELARRLKEKDISVTCVHPGIVATGIVSNVLPSDLVNRLAEMLFLSPQEGADTVLYLAELQKLNGSSGEYFARRQVAASSRASKDTLLAQKLWQASLELTGLEDKTEKIILAAQGAKKHA